MEIMNVFNGDAFSSVSLTANVNRIPVIPSGLGSLNLFEVDPITTMDVALEMAAGRLNLIPTTERGAPLINAVPDKRQMRVVRTPRIAKQRRLYAHEIAGIRPFEDVIYTAQGLPARTTVTELQQVATQILGIQIKLRADLDYTMEYHRLGAVQGVLLDADGSVLYNWFNEFSVTQPAEIDFDLDNATPAKGALRKKVLGVVRAIKDSLRGLWVDGRSYVLALTGNAFWDDLTSHVEVDPTYGAFIKTVDQISALQNWGLPDQTFQFAGVRWRNYEGDSAVSVGTDKVIFIPVNVPGLFRLALSPAEFLPFVGTLGKDAYSLLVRDMERDAWVQPEIYSYPVHYCTMPAALQRGRRT